MSADPVALFGAWLADAVRAELYEPTAMVVATADAGGRPSARTVLLKDVDARGFVFYTNYDSRKGRELDARPRAALVFLWARLERQVRVEGAVERIPAADSDAYFASRPRLSQVGAWASPQSREIASREELAARVREAEARFGADPIPRPPYWGGYRVVPDEIEFWEGQPGRLHDRIVYRRGGDGAWSRTRLAP